MVYELKEMSRVIWENLDKFIEHITSTIILDSPYMNQNYKEWDFPIFDLKNKILSLLRDKTN